MEHAEQLPARTKRLRSVRRFVGGFHLTMAGVTVGIVLADPEAYARFADDSYVPDFGRPAREGAERVRAAR